MRIDKNKLKNLYRWRTSTLLVMFFGYIGYYLMRQNLPAAVPLMHNALGYTNAELGLIAASSEIAYAVGKFVNGPLIDKHGGKKMFLIGMAGGIVCNLLFSLGTSLIWFVFAWCLCRYFLSMGWGSVTKTIGNWYGSEHNGRAMSFASLSLHFGGVLATLFAGWLVSMGQSWDKLFVAPALVLCLVLIWTYFASHARPEDVIPGVNFHRVDAKAALADFADMEKVPATRIIGTLLAIPIFRHLLAFSFLSTAFRSTFIFWTPKFLVDIGMGVTSAIFSSALLPFCGGIGVIAMGWYTDTKARDNRAQAMAIMLICLLLCLLGIALVANAGSGFHPLIIILLGMVGFFLLGPYSMSAGCLTLDIAGPKAAGTCVGMIDGVGYFGGALAVWGVGALADNRGWPQIFMLLACCVLPLIASAYAMSRHFQQLAKQECLSAGQKSGKWWKNVGASANI